MTRYPAVALGKRALFVTALQLVPYGVLMAQAAQSTMRRYVAAQALTELALYTNAQPTTVNAAAIRLERAAGIADRLNLWRAILPSDHSHPYLLASMNGGVMRLGGFTAPELRTVAPLLVRGELADGSARAVAQQLALLADPNGAIQGVFVDNADQPRYVSTVVTAWKRRAPRDWPRDTVMATEAGGWLVRLTLLSRNTRSYALQWIPLAFSFEFDRDGRLIAWAQRAGKLFGVAGVPIAPADTTGQR